MTAVSRQVKLIHRPRGWPTAADFETVSVELPELETGQLLVRNEYISVDPYMRGRMNDVPSYVPPFGLDEPMEGGAVGVVEASAAPDIPQGALVLHNLGWRDRAIVAASAAQVVDATGLSDHALLLGPLGMTGLTAYVGLLDTAGFQPGDTVFVSGAAGAVGQMAGQIARLKGAAKVIGSAGSDTKVSHLTGDLGFDAAFNYRDGSVDAQLRATAPEGIDVYFDNVGGDHLEAAIGSMNAHGRIAICGAIAQYNDTTPPAAPRNLALLIGKRITMRGFLVLDHYDRMGDFQSEVRPWLADGRLAAELTVETGIDNAVDAFLTMMRGGNSGKMVVKV